MHAIAKDARIKENEGPYFFLMGRTTLFRLHVYILIGFFLGK